MSLDTSSPISDPARRKQLAWAAGLLAVAAAASLLLPIASRGDIDAPDSVLRLPLVSHVKHVPEIFGRGFLGFTDGHYQPLSWAVLAFVRTVEPPDHVLFWRFWMLAFHLLGAFLVWRVAKHFARGPEGPLLAAGIYLLHPLAAAFTNRIELFPTAFTGVLYLGGFLAYRRAADRGGFLRWTGALALFAAGLLASPVVMSLPALILIDEVFHERERAGRILLRAAPYAVLVTVAILVQVLIRPHPVFYVFPPKALPTATGYWLWSAGPGGVDQALGLARGVSAPTPISGWLGELRSVWVLAPIAAVLLALLAVSAWFLRRGTWPAVGVFLLFAATLPRWGYAENATSDLQSWSYAVLPLAGFALLAGSLADRLLRSPAPPTRATVLAASCAVLLVFAGMLFAADLSARTSEGWWRHVLSENPASEDAAVALGKDLLADGREDEALGVLFSPYTDRLRPACLAMARYYASKGDWNAAAAHLVIVAREEGSGILERNEKLVLAGILARAGAVDYADQYAGNVLMVDPSNTSALRLLATLLAEKGFLPAAKRCLDAAADIDPSDAETAAQLAALCARMERPETLDLVTRVTPPHPEWLRYVTDQGGKAYMAAVLPQLADSHRRDPVIQMVAGISVAESGSQVLGLGYIVRAVERMPRCTRPYAGKCWVAACMDDRDAAFAALDGAPHPKPWEAGIWHQIGFNLANTNKKKLSLACMRKAEEAEPNRAELQNDVGALLWMTGGKLEALAHFRKALTLPGGDRAAILNCMGVSLRSLGRNDEAAAYFRRALARDPWYPQAYRNLARLDEDRGRWSDGIRTLSDAVRALPEDDEMTLELALLLAAAPDDRVRDGERAARLAETVCGRASPLTASSLHVLAAAYAEAGRFELAETTALRGAELARAHGNTELAGELVRLGRTYAARKPLRLAAPASPK